LLNKEAIFDYAGEKLSIQVITDESGLTNLEAEWRNLKATDIVGVFSSYEWIHSYWHCLGTGNLFILVARINGIARCIAPFAVTKSRLFGIPYKRVKFIGTEPSGTSPLNPLNQLFTIDHRIGWADKADFIALPEDAHLTGAIAHFLLNNSQLWDILDFREIQHPPSCMEHFCKVMSEGSTDARVIEGDPSAHIELTENFLAYIKSRSRNIRKNIQHYNNRLSRAGGSKFTTVTTPDEVKKALPEIKKLEMSSWKSKEGVGAFSDGERESFHNTLAEALARDNRFILFLLQSEKDDILAYYYSFLYDNKVYLHNTAFDSKAQKFSPGVILFLKVVEWSFEQGLTHVVIGRGGQYFKNAYRTGTQARSWHFIFRNSLLMRLLTTVELQLLPWLREKRRSLSENSSNTSHEKR